MRDLHHAYDPLDERDPMRRWPALFRAMGQTFGGGVYNRRSRTRTILVKEIDRHCARTRDRYGLCSRQRSLICHDHLVRASKEAASGRNRWALFGFLLSDAAQRDDFHEAVAQTVPAAVDLGIGDLLGSAA